MKRLLMMTALTGALAGQTLPAFADASPENRAQLAHAQTAVQEALRTDEGGTAGCNAMMENSGKDQGRECDLQTRTLPMNVFKPSQHPVRRSVAPTSPPPAAGEPGSPVRVAGCGTLEAR